MPREPLARGVPIQPESLVQSDSLTPAQYRRNCATDPQPQCSRKGSVVKDDSIVVPRVQVNPEALRSRDRSQFEALISSATNKCNAFLGVEHVINHERTGADFPTFHGG
jgi:hypothetical protein